MFKQASRTVGTSFQTLSLRFFYFFLVPLLHHLKFRFSSRGSGFSVSVHFFFFFWGSWKSQKTEVVAGQFIFSLIMTLYIICRSLRRFQCENMHSLNIMRCFLERKKVKFKAVTVKSSINFGAIASSCVPLWFVSLLNRVVTDKQHGRDQSYVILERKKKRIQKKVWMVCAV